MKMRGPGAKRRNDAQTYKIVQKMAGRIQQ
jgi:hypothetical protein